MSEAARWSAGGAPRCLADVVSTLAQIPKRLLVGRPLHNSMLDETLLPKKLALPVFCSDPLPSNAYATEEILLMLSLGALAAAPRALGRGRRHQQQRHRPLLAASGDRPMARHTAVAVGQDLVPSSVWVTTTPRQASACWRS